MPDDTNGPPSEDAPSGGPTPPAPEAGPGDLSTAAPDPAPLPPPPPDAAPSGHPPGDQPGRAGGAPGPIAPPSGPPPPPPGYPTVPLYPAGPGYPPGPGYRGPGYPPGSGYPPPPGPTPPSGGDGWVAPRQPDPAETKGSRRTRRVAVAVGLAVLILIGVGVTLIATSGSSSSSVSKTAQRLVRVALKSTIDGGSFHYVSTFVSRGQTQTTVGDAGMSSGRQIITIGSDSFRVLVIGTACYFQGDARQMVDQLGLPISIATPHAGQWISLAPGDLPYQSVYAAVTTHSALDDNIAFSPHQQSGTSTRAGYRVLGITGPMTNQFVEGQLQRAKGTASLYITASRPHLPVQYTEDGTIDKIKSTLVMTFSRWGETVTVTAPPGAVSYLSLGAGNGTSPTTGPPVLTAAPG